MPYFKTKKHLKFKYKKQLFISSIIIIICLGILYLFNNIKINFIPNNLTTYSLFNTSNNYLNDFINYSLGGNFKLEEKVKPVSNVIEDKNIISDKPIVYIYNTHQSEKYQTKNTETFNVLPSVLTVSYMLQEFLEEYGINSIVEEENITNILTKRNLIYSKSYEVSRELMNKAKKNNPTLTYFIDLHRDSSVYSKTLVEKDNKKYAKILFVVGKEHDNYEINLENTRILRDYIKKDNNYLIRGIYQKEGKGVNGIYNQDFNEHTFLIEVGGQYNYIDECYNTMKILASNIVKYIEDTYGKEKE